MRTRLAILSFSLLAWGGEARAAVPPDDVTFAQAQRNGDRVEEGASR